MPNIETSTASNIILSTIPAGDTFMGGACIVLEHLDNGYTAVLGKELKSMSFGSNNNYTESNYRKYLEEAYLPILEETFGAENIGTHEVDLY